MISFEKFLKEALAKRVIHNLFCLASVTWWPDAIHDHPHTFKAGWNDHWYYNMSHGTAIMKIHATVYEIMTALTGSSRHPVNRSIMVNNEHTNKTCGCKIVKPRGNNCYYGSRVFFEFQNTYLFRNGCAKWAQYILELRQNPLCVKNE